MLRNPDWTYSYPLGKRPDEKRELLIDNLYLTMLDTYVDALDNESTWNDAYHNLVNGLQKPIEDYFNGLNDETVSEMYEVIINKQ